MISSRFICACLPQIIRQLFQLGTWIENWAIIVQNNVSNTKYCELCLNFGWMTKQKMPTLEFFRWFLSTWISIEFQLWFWHLNQFTLITFYSLSYSQFIPNWNQTTNHINFEFQMVFVLPRLVYLFFSSSSLLYLRLVFALAPPFYLSFSISRRIRCRFI